MKRWLIRNRRFLLGVAVGAAAIVAAIAIEYPYIVSLRKITWLDAALQSTDINAAIDAETAPLLARTGADAVQAYIYEQDADRLLRVKIYSNGLISTGSDFERQRVDRPSTVYRDQFETHANAKCWNRKIEALRANVAYRTDPYIRIVVANNRYRVVSCPFFIPGRRQPSGYVVLSYNRETGFSSSGVKAQLTAVGGAIAEIVVEEVPL